MQIETGNNRLEMQSVNNKSLVEELDKLLEKLRMPSEVFPYPLSFCGRNCVLFYAAYLLNLTFFRENRLIYPQVLVITEKYFDAFLLENYIPKFNSIR